MDKKMLKKNWGKDNHSAYLLRSFNGGRMIQQTFIGHGTSIDKDLVTLLITIGLVKIFPSQSTSTS